MLLGGGGSRHNYAETKRRAGRYAPMTLASRATPAAKRSPAWLAGLALVGTWALTVMREREQVPAGDQPPAVRAVAPLQGWRFWRHVLYRVYEQITEDRLLSLAAGVVFYALLALFPAITALVSSYALYADPGTISKHLATLQNVMPAGSYRIVQEQINHIISGSTGGLSLAFCVSLAIALWSANTGLKAIIDALNVVYGVKEQRSFVRLNAVSLVMTVGAIAGLLLALAAVVVVPIVLSYLPFGGASAAIIAWLRWPALMLLLMIGLALLYRFGPNCEHPRWQWFSSGSVFAALAWLAGSLALSWYLGNFADYNATYGSLGAGIGLMMWLWISAIVVLVGAELNSEIAAARTIRRKPRAGQAAAA